MLGAVAIDRPALFLQGAVLLVAMLAVIFMAERTAAEKGAIEAANAKVAVTARRRVGFLYAAGVRGS